MLFSNNILKTFCLALALVLSSMPFAHAVNPDEILQDAALEKRARHLSTEIRCMVCQNQSIDDSDASVAKDLRVLIRERIVAGDSDAQVLDYLVDRFGEFVLLKPRFSLSNALLWLSPILVLLIGFFVIFRLLNKTGRAASSQASANEPKANKDASKLDKNEQKALDKILK